MFMLGMAWLRWRSHQAAMSNEGYGAPLDALPVPTKELREHAQEEGFDLMELSPPEAMQERAPPPVWLALLPVGLVVGLNLLFVALVIPAMHTAYLSLPLYGQTTVDEVRGIWAIVAALTITIVVVVALNWRRLTSIKRSVDDGANASVLPIFNTASLVGFVLSSLSCRRSNRSETACSESAQATR